jgi:hypothetical protein
MVCSTQAPRTVFPQKTAPTFPSEKTTKKLGFFEAGETVFISYNFSYHE